MAGGGPAGSRPSSSLSQQGSAAGGGAGAAGAAGGAAGAAGARPSPLRLRSGARRPRPSSIAGMPSPRQTADSGGHHGEGRQGQRGEGRQGQHGEGR